MLSIIVPCYNEADAIPHFFAATIYPFPVTSVKKRPFTLDSSPVGATTSP